MCYIYIIAIKPTYEYYFAIYFLTINPLHPCFLFF